MKIEEYQMLYGALKGAKIYYQNDEELGLPDDTLLTIADIDLQRKANQVRVICEEDIDNDGKKESFIVNLDEDHDFEVPDAPTKEVPKRKRSKGRKTRK